MLTPMPDADPDYQTEIWFLIKANLTRRGYMDDAVARACWEVVYDVLKRSGKF